MLGMSVNQNVFSQLTVSTTLIFSFKKALFGCQQPTVNIFHRKWPIQVMTSIENLLTFG